MSICAHFPHRYGYPTTYQIFVVSFVMLIDHAYWLENIEDNWDGIGNMLEGKSHLKTITIIKETKLNSHTGVLNTKEICVTQEYLKIKKNNITSKYFIEVCLFMIF